MNKHQLPSCNHTRHIDVAEPGNFARSPAAVHSEFRRIWSNQYCKTATSWTSIKCVFAASRYSVFADPIAHTIWELSPHGAQDSQPPPEAAPAVDFELLDMAVESGRIDVAQVSDWVKTKIKSLCKLAEVLPLLSLCTEVAECGLHCHCMLPRLSI